MDANHSERQEYKEAFQGEPENQLGLNDTQ
jgi:hypothetical protein